MASRKVNTATGVRDQITRLERIRRELIRLRDIYVDSDYAPGQADEITDEELEPYDMTAAQLQSVGTFLSALETFMEPYLEPVNKFIDPGG